MNSQALTHLVGQEFKNWQGKPTDFLSALNSGSGSNRQYFRAISGKESFVACVNDDIRENEAFFYLSDYYFNQGLRVPQVFFISKDRRIYFQQDLKDVNLLQILKKDGFTTDTENYYRQSLQMLWQMQASTKELDFNRCYPRASFDQQSVLWDLNYFKYYFLKLSGITFDEQLLENDLQYLAALLATPDDKTYFMFRDFQARNIQIHKNEVWFIDFQGGRRGPFLYDVASLFYQASANLSKDARESLLNYYYPQVSSDINYSEDEFRQQYTLMVFIRILQVLGAYGFRGLIEQKEYFKNSIPSALDNLQAILPQLPSFVNIPYFLTILDRITEKRIILTTN